MVVCFLRIAMAFWWNGLWMDSPGFIISFSEPAQLALAASVIVPTISPPVFVG